MSLTLTPSQTRNLMGKRYCRLVGILGAPDAGKTASLVSLYLLIARGKLSGFTYADSHSLRAFDEISQGARRWNDGQLPDQLTAHTELTDDRSAGFLHLRLRQDNASDVVDLLLPDLPGEWTKSMIDTKRVDRLDFLKRADVIWLMIDGRQLTQLASRQLALHRTKLLMQRLAALINPAPPIILVLTRRDQGKPPRVAIEELQIEAREQGLSLEVIMAASFANGNNVAPGTGIAELVSASTRPVSQAPAFWPSAANMSVGARAMMRIRRPEAI